MCAWSPDGDSATARWPWPHLGLCGSLERTTYGRNMFGQEALMGARPWDPVDAHILGDAGFCSGAKGINAPYASHLLCTTHHPHVCPTSPLQWQNKCNEDRGCHFASRYIHTTMAAHHGSMEAGQCLAKDAVEAPCGRLCTLLCNLLQRGRYPLPACWPGSNRSSHRGSQVSSRNRVTNTGPLKLPGVRPK